jgi:hypothetical protein
MATRGDVLSILKKKIASIEELGDTGIFRFEWDLGQSRSQVVMLNMAENYMHIISPFAFEKDITADKAIAANDSVWGLYKLNILSVYCLSHVVLLENADLNEIFEPLAAVAIAADEIERRLGLGDQF